MRLFKVAEGRRDDCEYKVGTFRTNEAIVAGFVRLIQIIDCVSVHLHFVLHRFKDYGK